MLRRFMENSAVYFGANLVSKVINFGLFVYLARVLSLDEMGRYSLLSAALVLLTLFMTLEIQSGYNRYFLEKEAAGQALPFELSILNLLALSNLAVGGLLFLCKPLIDRCFVPTSNELFAALLSLPFLNAIASLYLSKFRLQDRPLSASAVMIGQSIMGAGVTLLLMSRGMDKVLAIFLGLVAQNLGVLVLYVRGLGRVRTELSWPLIKQSIRFSALLIPSSIGAYLSTTLGKVIIGKLLNVAAVGAFEALNKVSSMISMIMEPMYTAAMPLVYRHFREPQFRGQFKMLLGVHFLILFGVAAVFGCFSHEWVLLVLGAKYVPYATFALPLILTAVFSVMARFFAVFIHLAERSQFDMIPELAGGLIGIAASVLLIGPLGLAGAIFGTTLAYFCRLGLYIVLAARLYPGLFPGYGFVLAYLGLMIGSTMAQGLLAGAPLLPRGGLFLLESGLALVLLLKTLNVSPRLGYERLLSRLRANGG